MTVFPVSGGVVWGRVNQRKTEVKACTSIGNTKVVDVQRCAERVKLLKYSAVTKEQVDCCPREMQS